MGIVSRITAVWHPERYHDPGSRRPWFEGWYMKLVSRDRSRMLALIPGMCLDGGEGDHCFIQVLDGGGATDYFRFPLTAFQAGTRPFLVTVGDSRFSMKCVDIDIHRDGRRIQGRVTFGPGRPWPVRLFSPGAMGWYAFVPGMECYHGVLSMSHRLEGVLTIDGRAADFSGGRGYVEKDWGSAFPSAYIWMQCNHFQRDDAGFFLSIARIPWRGNSFTGLLAALCLGDRLYRFTTYTGAVIETCRLSGDRVTIALRRRGLTLEVQAVQSAAGILLGPGGDGMCRHVSESLGSGITLRLSSGDTVLFEERGFPAALEAHGRVGELSH
ncbi:hypothetical protein JXO52_02505 [bacterium]|nr:hypothetical protein [bacterium]